MTKLQLPILNVSVFPESRGVEEKIYSRWSPFLKASDDTEETIQIYQPIGSSFFEEGFTARKMGAILRGLKGKDVVVSINSPGGDYFEGATIYNQLREYEGHVTVKIPGLAASAASLVAMAGDTILISEVGFYMIHDSWGMVMGNRNDMRKAADTFEAFDNAAADVYAARTGMKKADILAIMDDDTWLNGTDAVEKGFADELMNVKVVDDGDKDKKAKAMAKRSVEMALAKQGFSRKDREEIFQKAFGLRDAADVSQRDAGYEDGLVELLNTIRGGVK